MTPRTQNKLYAEAMTLIQIASAVRGQDADKMLARFGLQLAEEVRRATRPKAQG